VTLDGGGPMLHVTGLRKSFPTPAGPHLVLDGVDLTVAPGEVIAIGGRSGSGKTTLLTIIAGWEELDDGSVVFDDTIVPAAPRTWRDLAIVPQALGLLDELSIAENLALPLRLDADAPADDPFDMMARLGIDHLADRYPDEVSLGEQQRAALGRAAVIEPALLLADELLAHQNREWAETMMLVVGLLAAKGTACVLATHDEIAFERAHRVLELRSGRLVPLVPDEHGRSQ